MDPRLRSASSAFFTKDSATASVKIGILLIAKAIFVLLIYILPFRFAILDITATASQKQYGRVFLDSFSLLVLKKEKASDFFRMPEAFSRVMH
jgi:hypothetical protein